jgi:hypothetical protein
MDQKHAYGFDVGDPDTVHAGNIWHSAFVVGIIVIIIAIWSVFLMFVPPRDIVNVIGLTNTYAVIFLIAAIGGLSSVTGASLYAAVATAAAGGAHPIILALIGGVGILISDGIFFYAARLGRHTASRFWKPQVEMLVRWSERIPRWGVYVGAFLYTGFTPLPNDVLMVALALRKEPFRNIAPVLLAGDIIVVGIVAYAARAGLGFL